MAGRVNVVLRCDGSHRLGLGHVVRCVAVGRELRDLGADVSVAIEPDPHAGALVTAAGFPSRAPRDGWADADAVVVDVREGVTWEELRSARAAGTVVAVLDDASDRRRAASLAFYPPVARVRRLDWSGFRGELLAGWEWVALRREFRVRPELPRRPRPRVLVAAGGSDPAGITLRWVEALHGVDADVRVLLGPAYAHRSELERLLRDDFEVCENVADVVPVLADADLAVASFGVTAYELAALGVPAIHLCLTDDHADSAAAFVDAGIAQSLGRHDAVAPAALAAAARDLLADGARREAMGARGRELVDARGAERIARRILEAVA